MNRQGQKRKFWIKLIAILMIAAMVWQDVVWGMDCGDRDALAPNRDFLKYASSVNMKMAKIGEELIDKIMEHNRKYPRSIQTIPDLFKKIFNRDALQKYKELYKVDILFNKESIELIDTSFSLAFVDSVKYPGENFYPIPGTKISVSVYKKPISLATNHTGSPNLEIKEGYNVCIIFDASSLKTCIAYNEDIPLRKIPKAMLDELKAIIKNGLSELMGNLPIDEDIRTVYVSFFSSGSSSDKIGSGGSQSLFWVLVNDKKPFFLVLDNNYIESGKNVLGKEEYKNLLEVSKNENISYLFPKPYGYTEVQIEVDGQKRTYPMYIMKAFYEIKVEGEKPFFLPSYQGLHFCRNEEGLMTMYLMEDPQICLSLREGTVEGDLYHKIIEAIASAYTRVYLELGRYIGDIRIFEGDVMLNTNIFKCLVDGIKKYNWDKETAIKNLEPVEDILLKICAIRTLNGGSLLDFLRHMLDYKSFLRFRDEKDGFKDKTVVSKTNIFPYKDTLKAVVNQVVEMAKKKYPPDTGAYCYKASCYIFGLIKDCPYQALIRQVFTPYNCGLTSFSGDTPKSSHNIIEIGLNGEYYVLDTQLHQFKKVNNLNLPDEFINKSIYPATEYYEKVPCFLQRNWPSDQEKGFDKKIKRFIYPFYEEVPYFWEKYLQDQEKGFDMRIKSAFSPFIVEKLKEELKDLILQDIYRYLKRLGKILKRLNIVASDSLIESILEDAILTHIPSGEELIRDCLVIVLKEENTKGLPKGKELEERLYKIAENVCRDNAIINKVEITRLYLLLSSIVLPGSGGLPPGKIDIEKEAGSYVGLLKKIKDAEDIPEAPLYVKEYDLTVRDVFFNKDVDPGMLDPTYKPDLRLLISDDFNQMWKGVSKEKRKELEKLYIERFGPLVRKCYDLLLGGGIESMPDGFFKGRKGKLHGEIIARYVIEKKLILIDPEKGIIDPRLFPEESKKYLEKEGVTKWAKLFYKYKLTTIIRFYKDSFIQMLLELYPWVFDLKRKVHLHLWEYPTIGKSKGKRGKRLAITGVRHILEDHYGLKMEEGDIDPILLTYDGHKKFQEKVGYIWSDLFKANNLSMAVKIFHTTLGILKSVYPWAWDLNTPEGHHIHYWHLYHRSAPKGSKKKRYIENAVRHVMERHWYLINPEMKEISKMLHPENHRMIFKKFGVKNWAELFEKEGLGYIYSYEFGNIFEVLRRYYPWVFDLSLPEGKHLHDWQFLKFTRNEWTSPGMDEVIKNAGRHVILKHLALPLQRNSILLGINKDILDNEGLTRAMFEKRFGDSLLGFLDLCFPGLFPKEDSFEAFLLFRYQLIDWDKIPLKFKKWIVQMMAIELGKDDRYISTYDFSKKLNISGGKSLSGLLWNYKHGKKKEKEALKRFRKEVLFNPSLPDFLSEFGKEDERPKETLQRVLRRFGFKMKIEKGWPKVEKKKVMPSPVITGIIRVFNLPIDESITIEEWNDIFYIPERARVLKDISKAEIKAKNLYNMINAHGIGVSEEEVKDFLNNLYKEAGKLAQYGQDMSDVIEWVVRMEFENGEIQKMHSVSALSFLRKKLGIRCREKIAEELARTFFTYKFFKLIKGLKPRLDEVLKEVKDKKMVYRVEALRKVLESLRIRRLKERKETGYLLETLMRHYKDYREFYIKNKDRIKEIIGIEIDYDRDISGKIHTESIEAWLKNKVKEIPMGFYGHVGEKSTIYTLIATPNDRIDIRHLRELRGKYFWISFKKEGRNKYALIWESEEDVGKDAPIKIVQLVKNGRVLAQVWNGKKLGRSPIVMGVKPVGLEPANLWELVKRCRAMDRWPWGLLLEKTDMAQNELIKEITIYLIKIYKGDVSCVRDELGVNEETFRKCYIQRYGLKDAIKAVKFIHMANDAMKDIRDSFAGLKAYKTPEEDFILQKFKIIEEAIGVVKNAQDKYNRFKDELKLLKGQLEEARGIIEKIKEWQERKKDYILVGEKWYSKEEISNGKHIGEFLDHIIKNPYTDLAKESVKALKLLRNRERMIDICRAFALDIGIGDETGRKRNLLLLEVVEAIGIMTDELREILRKFISYVTYGLEIQKAANRILYKFRAEKKPKPIEEEIELAIEWLIKQVAVLGVEYIREYFKKFSEDLRTRTISIEKIKKEIIRQDQARQKNIIREEIPWVIDILTKKLGDKFFSIDFIKKELRRRIWKKYPGISTDIIERVLSSYLKKENNNITCGTICESGHEGSYWALDEQLKRQFEELRKILAEKGMVVEGDLNEEQADMALVEYAKVFGIKITKEQLQEFRKQIKDSDEAFRAINIFFSIPETDTELFWVGNDYAGGHFNRAGTRIHVSLPIILEKGIGAGIAIARHDLAHIQGKGHKEDEGLQIVEGLKRADKSAGIKKSRIIAVLTPHGNAQDFIKIEEQLEKQLPDIKTPLVFHIEYFWPTIEQFRDFYDTAKRMAANRLGFDVDEREVLKEIYDFYRSPYSFSTKFLRVWFRIVRWSFGKGISFFVKRLKKTSFTGEQYRHIINLAKRGYKIKIFAEGDNLIPEEYFRMFEAWYKGTVADRLLDEAMTKFYSGLPDLALEDMKRGLRLQKESNDIRDDLVCNELKRIIQKNPGATIVLIRGYAHKGINRMIRQRLGIETDPVIPLDMENSVFPITKFFMDELRYEILEEKIFQLLVGETLVRILEKYGGMDELDAVRFVNPYIGRLSKDKIIETSKKLGEEDIEEYIKEYLEYPMVPGEIKFYLSIREDLEPELRERIDEIINKDKNTHLATKRTEDIEPISSKRLSADKREIIEDNVNYFSQKVDELINEFVGRLDAILDLDGIDKMIPVGKSILEKLDIRGEASDIALSMVWQVRDGLNCYLKKKLGMDEEFNGKVIYSLSALLNSDINGKDQEKLRRLVEKTRGRVYFYADIYELCNEHKYLEEYVVDKDKLREEGFIKGDELVVFMLTKEEMESLCICLKPGTEFELIEIEDYGINKGLIVPINAPINGKRRKVENDISLGLELVRANGDLKDLNNLFRLLLIAYLEETGNAISMEKFKKLWGEEPISARDYKDMIEESYRKVNEILNSV